MSTSNFFSSEDVAIVFAFFFIACSMTSGHVIHVPSPKVFKSRLKGQVVCYACISSINDFNSRQSNDSNSTTDLYQTLEKAGILISKHVAKCAESYFPNIPNNYQRDLVFCPNTIMEPGTCVKLKGHYKGNQYIYRNCWNNMWIDKRPYARQMSERCYIDEMVQNFVATSNNKICFCEDDLCNSSHSILFLLSNNLYLIIIFITFLCLHLV
ncbi:putative integral membrane protein [Acanthocheilonema viteae]